MGNMMSENENNNSKTNIDSTIFSSQNIHKNNYIPKAFSGPLQIYPRYNYIGRFPREFRINLAVAVCFI